MIFNIRLKMIEIFNALVYPSGTYHFCQKDMHLVISGFENRLHIGVTVYQTWENQELYETCYYAKQYFEEQMGSCSISQLNDDQFTARYQNYGCYIASNMNSPLFKTFESDLERKCGFCKASLVKYDGKDQVWPPDTFHYCYDDKHIEVKGNDMILARADNDKYSKKAWSNYDRQDSCYHIRQYFQERSDRECNVEELIPYPVRSYGECFVSMNTNNSRIQLTEDLQSYLEGKCNGCNKGYYYQPEDDMNNTIGGNIKLEVINGFIFIVILLILVGY